MRRVWLLAVIATTLALTLAAQTRGAGKPEPKMRTFTTPYYIMHTDLDDDGAREAWIRMTKMFEAYKRRTAGFSGDIKDRFPFYLYTNREDYLAAGAPKDSAGVFMYGAGGYRLMAVAGEETTATTWHVVQHEGFHQFAAAVISTNLPVWVNEGLAEYFGEAIFTGDEYVTGLVPPGRLTRVQQQIADKKFKSLREIMGMTQKEWNDKMSGANYDQAWSMVHFLAHGDDGKYQKPFVAYMNQIARGKPPEEAWVGVFGRDTAAFQKRWEAWWLAQEPRGTAMVARKAVVLTLTSYLARAVSQGQTFETAQAFLDAAKAGQLKHHPEDWLPAYLLAEALKVASRTGTWSLEGATAKGQMPRLVCLTQDETKIVGAATIAGGRVGRVTVEVLTPTTKAATPKSEAK